MSDEQSPSAPANQPGQGEPQQSAPQDTPPPPPPFLTVITNADDKLPTGALLLSEKRVVPSKEK